MRSSAARTAAALPRRRASATRRATRTVRVASTRHARSRAARAVMRRRNGLRIVTATRALQRCIERCSNDVAHHLALASRRHHRHVRCPSESRFAGGLTAVSACVRQRMTSHVDQGGRSRGEASARAPSEWSTANGAGRRCTQGTRARMAARAGAPAAASAAWRPHLKRTARGLLRVPDSGQFAA